MMKRLRMGKKVNNKYPNKLTTTFPYKQAENLSVF